MKKFLILIIFYLLQTPLFSQNPSEGFLGSWYTFGSNHRLTEHLSLSPYGELRFYEPSSNYNLLFISLGGNYHINSKSTLGFGYAYLDIDTVFEFDNAPNVHENRFFEQYLFKDNWGKIKISHRGRLEQRFLAFSDRNEIQHRLRYRISLTYDFNKTLFATISEEPFLNFQDQAFHENRFYIGVGVKFLKNARFQMGYLKQHIRKNNLNRIMVGASFSTDHRKPKATATQQ